MERNNNNGGGVSSTSLLTLLFIGLKLTGFIDWSWWWVLAPVWGVLVLVAITFGCGWLWLQFKFWRLRKLKQKLSDEASRKKGKGG